MTHLDNPYPVEKENSFTFRFISIGPKGKVQKAVVFEEIDLEKKIYNLAFGDFTQNLLDDFAVTNNGDTWEVLATVAAITDAFFEINPDAFIFAQGSTPARTRLYRMGITKHYSSIAEKYTVLGYRNGEWEKFQINVSYESYLMSMK